MNKQEAQTIIGAVQSIQKDLTSLNVRALHEAWTIANQAYWQAHELGLEEEAQQHWRALVVLVWAAQAQCRLEEENT